MEDSGKFTDGDGGHPSVLCETVSIPGPIVPPRRNERGDQSPEHNVMQTMPPIERCDTGEDLYHWFIENSGCGFAMIAVMNWFHQKLVSEPDNVEKTKQAREFLMIARSKLCTVEDVKKRRLLYPSQSEQIMKSADLSPPSTSGVHDSAMYDVQHLVNFAECCVQAKLRQVDFEFFSRMVQIQQENALVSPIRDLSEY